MKAGKLKKTKNPKNTKNTKTIKKKTSDQFQYIESLVLGPNNLKQMNDDHKLVYMDPGKRDIGMFWEIMETIIHIHHEDAPKRPNEKNTKD